VLCVDIGSAFTKVALVDPAAGRLLATGEHPTTPGDLPAGVHAARGQAEAAAGVTATAVLACASTRGGTHDSARDSARPAGAEADRRVALTRDGHVVHVPAAEERPGGHRHVVVAAAARVSVREVFPRQATGSHVHATTPDAVRTGVALLARQGAVLVVDVGATTVDVYSAGPAGDVRHTAELVAGTGGAVAAALLAVRRHGVPPAPDDTTLLVGSGGLLRHDPAAAAGILSPLGHGRVAVDRDNVLFAAGLVAELAPRGAATLALRAGHETMGP
jgi:hypothetical protein